jgi:hypothetical protein
VSFCIRSTKKEEFTSLIDCNLVVTMFEISLADYLHME